MDGCVLNVERVHITDIQESVRMVVSEFDGKYWWIVMDSEVWDKREMIQYEYGYPIWNTQVRY